MTAKFLTSSHSLASFIACCLFVGVCSMNARVAAETPPNFVVLLTDDQSWVGTSLQIDPADDRSKSDYYLTPNIQRLAGSSMRFTRGYSAAPYCCPTRRSLLIGQTPARHIYQKDQPNWTTRYRQQLTLPQMLKQANPNYRSAHFGKWDMRYDDVTPQQMGYDVSDGYTDNGTGGGKGAGGPAASEDPKQIFGITQRTCDFMQQQSEAGRPFFVQVSHYAVHLDIFYRKQTLAKARAAQPGKKHTMPEFAAMTRDVDEGIGIVLDKIRSLGLESSTYVFFLSDNGGRGTMPGQKGKQQHRNHPLRDGKGSVYEGGIRVPYIVHGPGIAAGVVSDVPVTGLDIFPTVAQLAGYQPPLPDALDGGSLTSVMFGDGRGMVKRNKPFLLFHQAVARSAETALIQGDYKLVKTWAKNELELFDLSQGPEEERNLSTSHPDKVRELHTMMVEFLDEVGAETRKTGSKKEVYERAKPKPPSAPPVARKPAARKPVSRKPAADQSRATAKILPFGDAGKFKMLYDVRQRPQSVFINDKLYIVFNADAKPTDNSKGSAYPMLITYDPVSRTFSAPTRLGPSRSDHHYSPIIWADADDYLHVLHGCHRTAGTHLISDQPVRKVSAKITWHEGPQVAPSLSYPSVFRISGNRDLIYYRTSGHTSSWTYRISEDNGRTWSGPENDITDLDSKGRLDWSSYQTKLPSKDGKHLHVVYTDYDDNKNSPDPQRFFNPRYNALASNEWKYNLSYVKVNLDTHQVSNADGHELKTPIDIDYSKSNCEIWDTKWRGAGVPPAICLDRSDDPAFLHVLSEDDLKSHRYYYVSRKDGRWVQTAICDSNHQWNSCHLSRDEDGTLHAFVVVGESYLEGGYMDRHGGGRIEEWVSGDEGATWSKRRQLSPEQKQWSGWRFNNVQPVIRPDGSQVPGMLLFYGWKDKEAPQAKAFLLHE